MAGVVRKMVGLSLIEAAPAVVFCLSCELPNLPAQVFSGRRSEGSLLELEFQAFAQDTYASQRESTNVQTRLKACAGFRGKFQWVRAKVPSPGQWIFQNEQAFRDRHQRPERSLPFVRQLDVRGSRKRNQRSQCRGHRDSGCHRPA